MSRDLHFHDMTHGRICAEVDLNQELNNVADAAGRRGGLLGDVDAHADMMFNTFQLKRLVEELDDLAHDRPDLSEDVRRLREMAELVIRRAGYFWIVGD